MTQDPTILKNQVRQLQARLRSLVTYTKNARRAQSAYFSLPKTMSPEAKSSFLHASKQAEKQLDDFLKQLEYEKLT